MKLLGACLNWISEDHLDSLDAFKLIGLDEDEIEALGFAYLLDLKEEEDDN